jgi:GNAT superfamily N-acetyltransferase
MKSDREQRILTRVRSARCADAPHMHQLCAAGVQDLWTIGWGDPQLDDSLVLLWIEDTSGEPIGVLAYQWDTEDDGIWIELTHIAPEWRRKGVYTALFAELVRIGHERGATAIRSGIHRENTAMIRAAIRTGRELVAVPNGPYVESVLFWYEFRSEKSAAHSLML